MDIKDQQRTVTLIDDDGDRVTVSSDDSGASLRIERKAYDDGDSLVATIVLDEVGRRAAIEALGGRV